MHFTNIALQFIALSRYCVFYNLQVYGSPILSKYISANFPAAFGHFLSLSYFCNSCNIDISNLFIIIIFVMVICNQ